MGIFEALFAVAAVLSSGGAHFVRVDADGWAHAEAARPASIAADEHLWTWSDACAPSLADDCTAPAALRVQVIDAKRRPAAGARVIWATAKIAAELPDALLPSATADARGVAEIAAPRDGAVFARVAGPALACEWQDVRQTRFLAAVPAADVTIDAVDESGKRARRVRVSFEAFQAAADDRPKIHGAAEDGTIRLVLPKNATVRAVFWSGELAPAERTAVASELGRSIVLHPGATVRGCVRKAGGEGIAGARVQAVFAIPGSKSGLRRQTRTEANGCFALRGLAAGKSIVTVEKESFASLRRELDLAVGAVDLGRIELGAERTARIAVVDAATSKPLAGASLRVARSAVSATTGADGVAVLRQLGADDELDLRIAAAGYLDAEARVRLGARTPPVVRLVRGAVVKANVVARETGAAAGPGSVWVDLAGTKSIRPFEASGKIDIAGLAAGELDLEVRAPGFAPRKIARRTIAAGDVVDLGRLELDRGRAIAGAVVDRVTGEPLASARVRIPRPNASGPRLSLVMNDWISAAADENGRFRIAGVQPGDYRLLVEASGHAPLLSDNVTVGADDETDAGTLKLGKVHRLKIACTPARRCGGSVELLLGDANDDWATLRAPLADGKGELLPAPEGEHRLRLLERGAVVAEKSVDILPDADAQDVAIDVPVTEITGVVMRGGRPAAGGSVQFVGRAAAAMPVFVERRIDTAAVSSDVIGAVSRVSLAAVDGSGNFATSELAPGDYDVSYSGSSGTSPAELVTVPDRRAFSFRLDIAAAAIAGSVRDERGRAPEWARIEIRGANASMTTDAAPDGTFAIDGVPPGRVTLRAFNDSAEATRELALEDGRAASADLVLHDRAKLSLRGRVSGPDGAFVGGATVFFICDGWLRSATSDAQGVADVSLAASSATCSGAAFAADRGWAFAQPVSVTASGEPQEVGLRFAPRPVTLSLVSARSAAVGVRAPTGFPLERAFPFVGWPSGVSASAPLRLRGMPPGSYFVTLSSGDSRSLSVDGTKDIAISF